MVVEADRIRVYRNPRAATRDGAVRKRAAGNSSTTLDSPPPSEEISRWPGYAETPLRSLPALARSLGSRGARRTRTRAAASASRASRRWAAPMPCSGCSTRRSRRSNGGRPVDSPAMIAGALCAISREPSPSPARPTAITAAPSPGARGCSAAAASSSCTRRVSEARRAAIAHYGAEVIRVRRQLRRLGAPCRRRGAKHGWTVVSDTTYEGYRDIPIDVMHGYGVMSREIVRADGRRAADACLRAGRRRRRWRPRCARASGSPGASRRPQLVIVEPMQRRLPLPERHGRQAGRRRREPRHRDGGPRLRRSVAAGVGDRRRRRRALRRVDDRSRSTRCARWRGRRRPTRRSSRAKPARAASRRCWPPRDATPSGGRSASTHVARAADRQRGRHRSRDLPPRSSAAPTRRTA